MQSFIFGGNTGETPETVARKRAIAAALMGQIGNRPARNTGDGIGNALAFIGHGISANVMNRRAGKAEEAGQQEAGTLYDQIISGLKTGTPIGLSGGEMAGMDHASARVGTAHGDMKPYLDALASIESAGSGDYGAIGPTHDKLGRALGRYQVMEANIGPWSQAALGREVSPDEFMSDPQLQDSIAGHQFQQYMQQFGDPGMAAQAWFAGPGGVGTNRQDVLGTSVPEYAQKFNAALQPSQAQLESLPVGGQMQMGQGGMQRAPQQMAGGTDLQTLLQVASNPWLNEGQRGVINMLIEQQMQQQDPMRALELEKGQLEIEALRNPRAKDTDDLREYNYAVSQGYGGSFQQYMTDMKRAGATTVDARNMGNIPPGYRVKYDENGNPLQMEPIPGGPAALEAEQAQAAAGAKADQASRYGNVVVEDIDRAVKTIEQAPWFTTGLLGSWMSGIGGTEAHKLSKLLDTVKSNAGFDRLQAMRDSSPTGGALGQVSNIELGLLQAAIGSLEQSNDAEDLTYNLRRVQDIYSDIIHGPQGAQQSGQSKPLTDMTDEELEAIINGNR